MWVFLKKKEHKYTKYRPKWCGHCPFGGCDYCWGLAEKADKNDLDNLKEFCKNCDLADLKELNK